LIWSAGAARIRTTLTDRRTHGRQEESEIQHQKEVTSKKTASAKKSALKKNKPAVKKAAVKKSAVKKTAVKKAAPKKPAAKKTAARKAPVTRAAVAKPAVQQIPAPRPTVTPPAAPATARASAPAPAPTPAPVQRAAPRQPSVVSLSAVAVAPKGITRSKPVPAEVPAHTPLPGEDPVGIVTHYFSQLSVAVVELDTGSLVVGDEIRILGHTTDLRQKIDSLEVEHESVTEVGRRQAFGMKVKEHVREHDVVYKVSEF